MNTALLATAFRAASIFAHGHIVTPYHATGVQVFRYVTNSKGDILLCTPDPTSRNDCLKWQPIHAVVPKGKTYEGFRLNPTAPTISIEIYWK